MKPLAEQSLYEILELPPDAGSAEIAAALDRAQSIFGPGSLAMYTLMSPEDATTLARRIEEARATLLDPAARARYDSGLVASAAAAGVGGAAAWAAAGLPPIIPALKPAPEARPTPAPVPAPLSGEAGAAPAQQAAAPEAEVEARAEPPDEAPVSPAPPEAERPTHTPAPGGHVWPPPQPPAPEAEAAAAAPPEAPEAPAPLQLSAPAAPRPILLDREVPAARPAPVPPPPAAPPAAVRTPAPREASIPEFAAWSGDALRSVREARGLSLQQISERTKVTRHHIENIEADRYTDLPAAVYLRGILLSLARELRLDGQKVSRSYLERMTAALAPPPPLPPRR